MRPPQIGYLLLNRIRFCTYRIISNDPNETRHIRFKDANRHWRYSARSYKLAYRDFPPEFKGGRIYSLYGNFWPSVLGIRSGAEGAVGGIRYQGAPLWSFGPNAHRLPHPQNLNRTYSNLTPSGSSNCASRIWYNERNSDGPCYNRIGLYRRRSAYCRRSEKFAAPRSIKPM